MSRPEAENPRQLPKSRLYAQRFLKLYADHGFDYSSFPEFCDAFGLSYGYFRKLRSQNSQFADACEKLEARDRVAGPPTSEAPVQARKRWPHLELWKGLFVERYRETWDRERAWKMVDKTWDDIASALAADPAFLAAYQSAEREFEIRVEDALKRKALRGTTQAQHLLGALGNPLGAKPKKTKEEERPKGFQDLFAAHVARRQAADAAPSGEEALPETDKEIEADSIDNLADRGEDDSLEIERETDPEATRPQLASA